MMMTSHNITAMEYYKLCLRTSSRYKFSKYYSIIVTIKYKETQVPRDLIKESCQQPPWELRSILRKERASSGLNLEDIVNYTNILI